MATMEEANANNIRNRTRISVFVYNDNHSLILRASESAVISATLSLRSDLSREKPSFPESEIEMEIYWEEDISDTLASAGVGLEVSFRCYPDGVSDNVPRRRFYTDEYITWNNKKLHIHAVDQVNKLDEELPPIYLGQIWLANNTISNTYVLCALDRLFADLIGSNIEYLNNSSNYLDIKNAANIEGTFSTIPSGGALNSILPRMTRREAISKIMHLCHWQFETGALRDRNSFWPAYVDAGIPRISNIVPETPQYTIYEEDCGNVVTSKEPVYNEVSALVCNVEWSGSRLKQNTDVSATAFKQKGLAFNYNGLISDIRVGLSQSWEGPNGSIISGWMYETSYEQFDLKERALPISSNIYPSDSNWMKKQKYGMWLLDNNPELNPFSSRSHTFIDLSGAKWTTANMDGFVPNETPQACWNDWITDGSIVSNATDAELETRSHFFMLTNDHISTKTKTGDGGALELTDDVFWNGHAKMQKYDNSGSIDLLPDKAIETVLNQSNVIGSFTWKGDPRMQPRDLFTFVKAGTALTDENDDVLLTESDAELWINEDGDQVVCTIENITLTLEKGGMIAEITYREGIC